LARTLPEAVMRNRFFAELLLFILDIVHIPKRAEMAEKRDRAA
jgi:hypothetical protein